MEDEWAGAEAREYGTQTQWSGAKAGLIRMGARRKRPIEVTVDFI